MKRLLFLILGLSVSFGCLAYAMRNTSLQQLRVAFANANYSSLPLILGTIFGFYWLKAIRWKWLLNPVAALPTKDLFPPVMIGFAANNILPAHLGEFVRVFVANRKFRIPASTVLSTIVLERILDVLAILALFGIGLFYAPEMPAGYRQAALVFGGAAAAIVVMVVLYLIWTDLFIQITAWCFARIRFLPHRLTENVLQMLRQGAEGLHALKNGRTVVALTINSLAQWTLNGLGACLCLRAFHIDVDLSTGLILTGITAFGVMIPSAPGYFGVIQICFETAMKAQAIQPDPEQVLGASLYSQISSFIPVTALGMYYLQQAQLRLSDVSRAAEASQDVSAESSPDTSALPAPMAD
jgi:uncharacterized protein (TIRG00374 family)